MECLLDGDVGLIWEITVYLCAVWLVWEEKCDRRERGEYWHAVLQQASESGLVSRAPGYGAGPRQFPPQYWESRPSPSHQEEHGISLLDSMKGYCNGLSLCGLRPPYFVCSSIYPIIYMDSFAVTSFFSLPEATAFLPIPLLTFLLFHRFRHP